MASVLPVETVDNIIKELRIPDPGRATIREIVALVNRIEAETEVKYIRMEMGVPGLKPAQIGVEAEIKALKDGVAAVYPMVDGLAELKNEASRFIKTFMDVEIAPQGCIPTVGSMQGTYSAFLAAGNIDKTRNTALFIDPGFPVQKQQMMVLGLNYETFDVFSFRGPKLKEKLESYLQKGNICSIIYSNPNNPTWICLTEEELQIIGELARKYDVIVMEDLAYFAMDFRKSLDTPGRPPYQATVAKYTDQYILFISSSKIFSYAGQRCAVMAISDKLFQKEYPELQQRFHSTAAFGNIIVQRILYSLTSGTTHSCQYALAAMFKAASDGRFNFVNDIKEYGEKAHIMKRLFCENGFYIVYDKDLDETIADGFYFTIGYPGMNESELVLNLLHFGISAIGLKDTGSLREGIRACVSHVSRDQFPDLEKRLKLFNEFYKDR
ncbi:MAG TPA: pyridoxal phosphate-dependent aminotransferase [Prolixibacteraceae bacterium]|nr:pyridoxal phosphate-dependent aminotransferase [Prolixibacteraceae bacterium]